MGDYMGQGSNWSQPSEARSLRQVHRGGLEPLLRWCVPSEKSGAEKSQRDLSTFKGAGALADEWRNLQMTFVQNASPCVRKTRFCMLFYCIFLIFPMCESLSSSWRICFLLVRYASQGWQEQCMKSFTASCIRDSGQVLLRFAVSLGFVPKKSCNSRFNNDHACPGPIIIHWALEGWDIPRQSMGLEYVAYIWDR